MDLRSAAALGKLFEITHPTDFRTAYRTRLRRRSNLILRDLRELADSYPGVTLVLMCFERDWSDCHRLQLAEWLTQRLGVVGTGPGMSCAVLLSCSSGEFEPIGRGAKPASAVTVVRWPWRSWIASMSSRLPVVPAGASGSVGSVAVRWLAAIDRSTPGP
jgi:hypothetical protein